MPQFLTNEEVIEAGRLPRGKYTCPIILNRFGLVRYDFSCFWEKMYRRRNFKMIKAKRLTAIFMVLMVMIMTLAGCGSSAGQQTNETTDSSMSDIAASAENTSNAENTEEMTAKEVQENTPSESEAGSSILVVYFSRTGEQYGVGVIDEGNTAIVANMIIDATGADSFEILPEDDYYPMTYDELTDVARQEQNENARPAYAGDVPDLSQYSTIFIGAPVWWGDWPMICYTFFENEDLSGKTLYPFSTHAGSGLSGFDSKLSSAVPDSTVGEGLSIEGTDCQNDREGTRSKVENWLSGLGY